MGIDLSGRTRPVDPGLGRSDFPGIGRFTSLGRFCHRATLDGCKGSAPKGRPRRCHSLREAGGRVCGIDRHILGQQDRSLIQSLGHTHDLDARPGIPGHDGALDGCRSSPARKQGAVQVETAQTRGLQHLGLENLAIGNNAGRIQIKTAEGLDRLG